MNRQLHFHYSLCFWIFNLLVFAYLWSVFFFWGKMASFSVASYSSSEHSGSSGGSVRGGEEHGISANRGSLGTSSSDASSSRWVEVRDAKRPRTGQSLDDVTESHDREGVLHALRRSSQCGSKWTQDKIGYSFVFYSSWMGPRWMGPWPIVVSHFMRATCQFMDKESCWSNSSRSTVPYTSRPICAVVQLCIGFGSRSPL